MKKLAISKDRAKTVQKRIERLNKDSENYDALRDFYLNFEDDKLKQENDPEWQKNNLEYDLRTSEFIVEKCKNRAYAQNIYAALCNNEFIKNDVMPILKEEYWSCTWRYAGGIVADLTGEGDYLDWYCSGIRHDDGELTSLYVGEGDVTDEVKEDLFKLGWLVADTSD
jgi:predicted DNA binding CopG/RHH family protein